MWLGPSEISGHQGLRLAAQVGNVCIYCHTSGLEGSPAVMTPQEENEQSFASAPSQGPMLLPSTDLSLYPFSVINYIHEHNIFLWILWGLLSNYKPESGLGKLLKLAIGVRREGCLVGIVASDLAAWLTLVTEQGSQRPSAGIGRAHRLQIRAWVGGSWCPGPHTSLMPKGLQGAEGSPRLRIHPVQ